MDFREADRRYANLKARYDNGSLSAEEFDARLEEMMVQDDAGRWWAKSRETGDWYYYEDESDTWVQDTPPGYHRTPTINEPRTQTPPPVQESPIHSGYLSGPTVQSSGVPAGLWISLGIVCALIALFFYPPVFGGLGIVFGYLAVRKGSQTGGIVTIVISGVCLVFGFIFGLLVWGFSTL